VVSQKRCKKSRTSDPQQDRLEFRRGLTLDGGALGSSDVRTLAQPTVRESGREINGEDNDS
jgi:hypothetical protein